MRVWYQSFTDADSTQAYHARLSEYLRGVATPPAEFVVKGMRPASRMHRITELRCGLEVVRNAIRAEREGFDAFVLGHFQDSGLWEARAAVRIPVVGIGESSMLHACTLARRIGLITIDPIHIPYHEEQIARYGLASRVTDVTAVRATPADYVRAMHDESAFAALREQYLERIAALASRGVELAIAAGGLGALLFADSRKGLGGAAIPTLNALPVAVKAVEAAVALRRLDGTGASRAATFALPSQAAIDAVFTERGADA